MASYYHQTKEEAFETWKRVYISKDKSEQEIYSTVKASDMQESYWVKLKDPNKFKGVESSSRDLDGVAAVRDLRQVLKPIYFWMEVMKWGAISVAAFLLVAAILQVANTIRLAAFARRKEIGIMRLVGASSLYISLPFLMETLVAALIGIGLSCADAADVHVLRDLRQAATRAPTSSSGSTGSDAYVAVGGIAILGVLLTLIPTLVMTRKYLKV